MVSLKVDLVFKLALEKTFIASPQNIFKERRPWIQNTRQDWKWISQVCLSKAL